ncbi:transposase [Gammaproteobacteria bacterium]
MVVHSAGLQDRDGAMAVLTIMQHRFPSIRLVWADSGYAGALVSWVAQYFLFVLEIIRRPTAAKGFVLLPRRWVVERTFGWLGRSRRLSKDYERLPASGEAFIYLSMTHLMLRRLKPK